MPEEKDIPYLKGVPKVYIQMIDPSGYICEEFWIEGEKEYTSPRETEGIYMVFGDAIRKHLSKSWRVFDGDEDGNEYETKDDDGPY
jgi:hypothetical protein